MVFIEVEDETYQLLKDCNGITTAVYVYLTSPPFSPKAFYITAIGCGLGLPTGVPFANMD